MFNPDPEHVRWINPNAVRGVPRDVVVNVGEGGGIWMLDKYSGEFLWSTPFPFNVDNYFLSDIDVETGRTHINQELLVDSPGENHIICYFNTRSFWPTAYYPEKNALYVPYIRNCLDMTAADEAAGTRERRVGSPEPGVPEEELNGLARVNLETGEITHWPHGRIPNNSAILATAGNLIFWGDIDRRYEAVDADTGEVLWQTVLGGPISVSNITYEVDGRQYVAVIAGKTLSQQSLSTGSGPIPLDIDTSSDEATLYVFALPQSAASPE
jgi:alcohol dehydrogenase (cytochrome c)